MASPYSLTNTDLQFVNCAGQSFQIYLAILNPIAITTNWGDINQDAQGNWQPPPNFDTCAHKVAPYQPVANLGSNRIGFVNEPLHFDGSRSCQRFDLPVVSYAWTTNSPNAIITSYANNAQISILWPAAGLYTVSLTVKDRAGTTTTGTRQVMIYQDRTHALPGMISLSGPQGSLSSGGWQCQIDTVNTQVSLFAPDALPVGTYQPIVILAETSYEILPGYWVNRTIGPNGQFNPGSAYQDPRILFDGYIQAASAHQDVDKDTLTFTCVGPQMILQEAKSHMVGYYNATYKTYVNNVPTACNTSPAGQGYLVGGLMSADVITSILQYHSNVANFHDIHQWNACIPANPYNPSAHNVSYNMVYTTLSCNEGTIWQNIQDLAANEWGQAYCEHDGSIRIGPQVNFRGSEFWQQSQLLGNQASTFLNFLQDLGYTLGNTLATLPTTVPMLPALPMPVSFVHPWSGQTAIAGYFQPFQSHIDPSVLLQQQQLVGPPIVCTFSDIPVYDTQSIAPTMPGMLFPHVQYAWPQDLSVYPIAFDVTENYSGRATLVKMIGTLVNSTSILTSWFPQNTFQITSDGTSTIVISTLPAGNWVIDESHVIPDMTNAQNKTLVLNWWWEMARRYYYSQNINYTANITCGMFTAISLGNIVALTRQNNSLGPHWSQKPFFVDDISYSIDMTNRTWSTTFAVTEVTSILMGPIQPPPAVVPKG